MMLSQFGVVNLWAYLIGAIFIILIPGPNSLFVLASSIKHGMKRGCAAASGIFLGDSLLIFFAYLGVASILNTMPVLFHLIQYAGAAYLFYLGIRILYHLFSPAQSTQHAAIKEEKLRYFFLKAMSLSLTNPKAIIFMVSFFVQFIDPTFTQTYIPFLILGGILMTINVAYLSFLIVGGAALSAYVKNRPWLGKYGNCAIGILFIGFSVRLLIN